MAHLPISSTLSSSQILSFMRTEPISVLFTFATQRLTHFVLRWMEMMMLVPQIGTRKKERVRCEDEFRLPMLALWCSGTSNLRWSVHIYNLRVLGESSSQRNGFENNKRMQSSSPGGKYVDSERSGKRMLRKLSV